jgi:hypothetical protein
VAWGNYLNCVVTTIEDVIVGGDAGTQNCHHARAGAGVTVSRTLIWTSQSA